MKATITNTSRANQGVWTEEGLVHIEPGKTRTVTLDKDYVDRAKALPFLRFDAPQAQQVEPVTGTDGLDAMKVADLRTLAADEGVDLGDAKTKPAIITAIRAKRTEPDNADPRNDDELRAAVIEKLGDDDGVDEMERADLLALLGDE